ncbi:MAG: TetR/AcrR family transcriptional regulator [Bacteroidota bacterium]|nr:TetR/AcrR family transcriptional regulator [Bacteroidota bacterium]
MVAITHSGENIFRLNQILAVAQKHFGMYGLEKSTMREIAAELNMSKGALYYYFSDKEQLYKAVVEKEQDEFIRLIEEKLSVMNNPKEMLMEYLDIRMKHFRTMLNLSRFRMEEFCNLKPIMGDTWMQFLDKEIELVERIITMGIKLNIFFIEHPHEVSQLFLDLLKGLRKNELHNKLLYYLDKKEYDILVDKTVRFTKIFIRGLEYKEN